MSWNYRVIKNTYDLDNIDDTTFAIHEVYYSENGRLENYTIDPVLPVDNSVDNLRFMLKRMLSALDEPILAPEDFGCRK